MPNAVSKQIKLKQNMSNQTEGPVPRGSVGSAKQCTSKSIAGPKFYCAVVSLAAGLLAILCTGSALTQEHSNSRGNDTTPDKHATAVWSSAGLASANGSVSSTHHRHLSSFHGIGGGTTHALRRHCNASPYQILLRRTATQVPNRHCSPSLPYILTPSEDCT